MFALYFYEVILECMGSLTRSKKLRMLEEQAAAQGIELSKSRWDSELSYSPPH